MRTIKTKVIRTIFGVGARARVYVCALLKAAEFYIFRYKCNHIFGKFRFLIDSLSDAGRNSSEFVQLKEFATQRDY